MSEASTLPLLEVLAREAGCEYLSDLHALNGQGVARLYQAVEGIPSEAVSLHDWNDALAYLVQAPPEESSQAARAQLLAMLAGR